MLVLYAITGIVLVLVGIPLVLGAVPPNRWYGYRTRATLTDATVWYAVNRITGVWLIAIGSATAAVAIWSNSQGFAPEQEAIVDMVPIVVGVIGCILHATVAIRRMANSE